MLRVEERFVIRELYGKGVSISEIARLTGHDRKTIRAALSQPLLPAPRPARPPRASKLDPYVPYLEQRLADGVFNARKLYLELRQRGYPGKETMVRAFVQPLREARRAKATVRFETAPGEQAQVDWGHFGTIEQHGRQRRLYGFVMTLGWSRATYLEFTTSMESAWFLRCHLFQWGAAPGAARQPQAGGAGARAERGGPLAAAVPRLRRLLRLHPARLPPLPGTDQGQGRERGQVRARQFLGGAALHRPARPQPAGARLVRYGRERARPWHDRGGPPRPAARGGAAPARRQARLRHQPAQLPLGQRRLPRQLRGQLL